jgi:hypothetical protein
MLWAIAECTVVAIKAFETVTPSSARVAGAMIVTFDPIDGMLCSNGGSLAISINDLLEALVVCHRTRACSKLTRWAISTRVAFAQTSRTFTVTFAIALVTINQWACSQRAVEAICLHCLECRCEDVVRAPAFAGVWVAHPSIVTDEPPGAVGAEAEGAISSMEPIVAIALPEVGVAVTLLVASLCHINWICIQRPLHSITVAILHHCSSNQVTQSTNSTVSHCVVTPNMDVGGPVPFPLQASCLHLDEFVVGIPIPCSIIVFGIAFCVPRRVVLSLKLILWC